MLRLRDNLLNHLFFLLQIRYDGRAAVLYWAATRHKLALQKALQQHWFRGVFGDADNTRKPS